MGRSRTAKSANDGAARRAGSAGPKATGDQEQTEAQRDIERQRLSPVVERIEGQGDHDDRVQQPEDELEKARLSHQVTFPDPNCRELRSTNRPNAIIPSRTSLPPP